ncbi:hypothetical protein [Ralstonia sp. 24A2]|uniref:hypothetical protein n=1 Tax=Ralstonia sp. 24A2 TaxID=3447364 RepID=UPI003F6A261D
MHYARLLLALLTCAASLTITSTFAHGADMTDEAFGRMTGVDPLWVHVTPCLAVSTFEQSMAKQRANGVTLIQLREQLRDQLASHPEIDEIIAKLYAVEETAIPAEIRQRHVACVGRIIGAPLERIDACYARNYAPFLQALFGAHPQTADLVGTRQAYTACLQAMKVE